jgi:hypothetical protein
MPPVRITSKPGADNYNDKDGKAYSSYNYAYAAQPDLFNTKSEVQHSLSVGFAFGIDFFDKRNENVRKSMTYNLKSVLTQSRMNLCTLPRSLASTGTKYSFGSITPAGGPKYGDVYCC